MRFFRDLFCLSREASLSLHKAKYRREAQKSAFVYKDFYVAMTFSQLFDML